MTKPRAHVNPLKSADITIVHTRPGVVQAQWRDPDDSVALERGPDGRRHQRTISGFRAIDPLDRLPCEVPHRRAAARLRMEWEIGSGARSGTSMDFVDNSRGSTDTMAGQLEARRQYQDAVQALGQRACAYVLPVVLSWWTVADLVARHGGNVMAMQGRVMSGLDRLVDHYFPPKEPARPFEPPPNPQVVDPGVTDLGQERLGRWRKPPGTGPA